MKRRSSGIVRKIDDLGRVVLPKSLRQIMGMNEGDSVEFFVEGDEVRLKKYVRGCRKCGAMEDLIQVGDDLFCGKCFKAAEPVQKSEQ